MKDTCKQTSQPRTAPRVELICTRGDQPKSRIRIFQHAIPSTSGVNRTRRILPVIQGTFAAIERAENYLPLQPFFNNTPFGQTLINCIHNQHRIGIPDEYFVETCINTSIHNGFVTKEFVKIDEDSQTQDYTIIYIKFQGQTPPFSTHNRDIFERVLPTPFPQVGDILSEEENN